MLRRRDGDARADDVAAVVRPRLERAAVERDALAHAARGRAARPRRRCRSRARSRPARSGRRRARPPRPSRRRARAPPRRPGTRTGRRPREPRTGSPSTVSSTGRPPSLVSVASACSRASPGCGASSAPSSSLRMIPSRRRISASASRPVSSTAARASRSRPWSSRRSRRTPAACTVMTEIECATTSWSSRAILARSFATAVSDSTRRRSSANRNLRLRLTGLPGAVPHREPGEPRGGEEHGDPDVVARAGVVLRKPRGDEHEGRDRGRVADQALPVRVRLGHRPRREQRPEEEERGVVERLRLEQRGDDERGEHGERRDERRATAQQERQRRKQRGHGQRRLRPRQRRAPDLDDGRDRDRDGEHVDRISPRQPDEAVHAREGTPRGYLRRRPR